MTPPNAEAGFTLIEAMVALVVLAVASAGLVRATEAHVDTLRGLQQRMIAQWVAENRLVELGLGGAPAAGEQDVEMLGRRWSVRTAPKASEDPDLTLVEVSVRAAGRSQSLAALTGFVDTGAGR